MSFLHNTGIIRGLSIECPVCKSLPGVYCVNEKGKPVMVHTSRERKEMEEKVHQAIIEIRNRK